MNNNKNNNDNKKTSLFVISSYFVFVLLCFWFFIVIFLLLFVSLSFLFFFLQTLHQDMRSNDSLAGCHVVIWYLFDVSQSFCLYLYYLQLNSGKPLLCFTRHH